MTITFAQLEQAKAILSKQIVDTPTIEAPRLAQLTNVKKLYLKLDLYQYTGSFKDRGTLNKLANLTPEQAKNGVIAMSAGNHAQGLAYHAKRMGIPTTIVMPQATPFNKIERTRNLGARVLLHGTSLDVAADYARQVAKKENLTFVHPYDDPLIIAGQGTLGLELLDKVKDLDIVVVPVGGGGLIAGIALAVKTLNPAIEVIGVQTKSYPAVYNAFYQTTGSSQGSTIAEGIAVPSPGGHTLP
ncbi:MAG TPA: pyridoxal-phosphate dependent enzyme, partial [Alphaproteobacteria bacterium]|nr:pyridoxal-phosphate dependent enzyme [Alphaproteobacteria bacterium]